MTGRELLLSAIRGEKTERAAWLPYVGCHGGFLAGVPASRYLRSAKLIVEGLTRAVELYRPDGLPVLFDLQLEAEVLGCQLSWFDEAPPAVISHPLCAGTFDQLPAFTSSAGRLPVAAEALTLLKSRFPDEVALYGLVCGPFTLALHLIGNDIFLLMNDDPGRVLEVMAFCAGIAAQMSLFYLGLGADVIAVVDPVTSQISPRHFDYFVSRQLNRVFDGIRSSGGISSLFVCGDVSRNLELMCATKAQNISVDEQVPIDRLRDLCLRRQKSFGGNVRLTSVLLLGSEDDAKLEALDIIDRAGSQGFILAPGCDLPYATPPRNLQAVSEMVHDPDQRDLARACLKSRAPDSFVDICLPEYELSHAVVIDVITLDSTSCAPCQYMLEAVQRAAEASPFRTYVNEHRIKVRQGLGMMARLGVKSLPTICIDGEIKFSSIIPDQTTLVAAIGEAARKKTQA